MMRASNTRLAQIRCWRDRSIAAVPGLTPTELEQLLGRSVGTMHQALVGGTDLLQAWAVDMEGRLDQTGGLDHPSQPTCRVNLPEKAPKTPKSHLVRPGVGCGCALLGVRVPALERLPRIP